MAFPEPKPGLVVRYDYLWRDEHARAIEHGKDRPACLIAAIGGEAGPRQVVLLPITHTPPSGDTVGVEIPPRVKEALGLDDLASWIILSEHNVDEWPNSGLSPVPGGVGRFAYGVIPPGLFTRIKTGFLSLSRQGKTAQIRR